jgi:hypothetical protein
LGLPPFDSLTLPNAEASNPCQIVEIGPAGAATLTPGFPDTAKKAA